MRAGLNQLRSRLGVALSSPIVQTTDWRTRDLFWLSAGLLIGALSVMELVSSPVLVFRAESLIFLIAATLAAVFFLSRRGVLLPSAKPLEPEATAALARAKRGVGPLIALVLATALALQLVSGLPHLIVRPQLIVLSAFWALLVFSSSSTLTRAEAVSLSAALTVILFTVQDTATFGVFLAFVVLAAVLYRFVFRRHDRLRMWTVRLLAGLLIAAGIYLVAFALMGEVISLPLAVIAAVLVGLDQRRDLRRSRPKRLPIWRRPMFLGSATLLAWIAFLGWSGLVDYELGAAGFGVDEWGRGRGPYPSTTSDHQKVAEAYEPLFVFAKRERWLPSDPADYLRRARALRNGRVVDAASCKEPDQSPLCVLTIDCPDPDDDCAEEPENARSAVFARVIDNPLGEEGFDRARARPPLNRLTRLIQYWTFYRYDDWRRWQFDGWHQWHEGDWEWVAVGLSDSGPILAAYSAHCGGNWRRWRNLAALAGGERDALGMLRPLPRLTPGEHVLAFVGQGTHAAYPDGRERAPNWATCTRFVPAIAEALTWGPAHSINVREIMPVDSDLEERALGPPVELATDLRPDFMQYQAYWGPANHTRTLWRGGACPPQHKKKRCDHVAETPPLKPAWRRPIATIFCNSWWHPRRHCPPRKRR